VVDAEGPGNREGTRSGPMEQRLAMARQVMQHPRGRGHGHPSPSRHALYAQTLAALRARYPGLRLSSGLMGAD